jgi:hypothetical protein
MRMFIALSSFIFSGFLGAQVMDTDTPDTQYLTDEEQKLSREFVHEGLAEKIRQQECEGIEAECKGEKGDEKFLGIPSEMVELVGQAYTMIAGVGGVELKMSDSAIAKARETDPMARDSKPDYCSKIPMASDLLAKFKQTSEQENLKNLPAEGETVQKQELLKAAQSHKIRSETSGIQAIGYGTTVGCYVGMVAMGGVAVTSVLVKIPAAGILTAFHTTNAIRQKKMYERIKKIADKMPGKGYCNPITEKTCYCDAYKDLKKDQEKVAEENEKRRAEIKEENTPSTFGKIAGYIGLSGKKQQFVEKVVIVDEAGADKYCRPKLHDNSVAEDSLRVSCLDKEMQLDPFCKCKGQNSCYDQKFIKFSPDITPEMFASSGLEDFSAMTRGELRGGRVGSGGFGRNAVKSNSLLKQFALKYPATGDINPQGLSRAKMAEDTFGIPKELAAHLTATPPTAADKEAGKKVVGSDIEGETRIAAGQPDQNQVLAFGQQQGGTPQRRGGPQAPEEVKLQRGKASESGDVLQFAEKASAKAQIEQRPESNIFQLISKRYQITGPRYLKTDGENPNAK